MLVYGAGAAWSRLFFAWSRSRPNLVRARFGSGTSDFLSRSRPKKLAAPQYCLKYVHDLLKNWCFYSVFSLVFCCFLRR